MCNIAQLTYLIDIDQYFNIGDNIFLYFSHIRSILLIIAQQQYMQLTCGICLSVHQHCISLHTGHVIMTRIILLQPSKHAAHLGGHSMHQKVATTTCTALIPHTSLLVVTARATFCHAQRVLSFWQWVRSGHHAVTCHQHQVATDATRRGSTFSHH